MEACLQIIKLLIFLHAKCELLAQFTLCVDKNCDTVFCWETAGKSIVAVVKSSLEYRSGSNVGRALTHCRAGLSGIGPGFTAIPERAILTRYRAVCGAGTSLGPISQPAPKTHTNLLPVHPSSGAWWCRNTAVQRQTAITVYLECKQYGCLPLRAAVVTGFLAPWPRVWSLTDAPVRQRQREPGGRPLSGLQHHRDKRTHWKTDLDICRWNILVMSHILSFFKSNKCLFN